MIENIKNFGLILFNVYFKFVKFVFYVKMNCMKMYGLGKVFSCERDVFVEMVKFFE